MAKIETKKYDPTTNPYSSRYEGDIASSGLNPFSKQVLAARQAEGYSDTDKLAGDSGWAAKFKDMSNEALRTGHPASLGVTPAGKKLSAKDYTEASLAHAREVRRRAPSGTKMQHFLLDDDQGGQ
jgi:hypothetical protein